MLSYRLDVGASSNQDDIGTGLVQTTAENAADGTGSKDHDSHGNQLVFGRMTAMLPTPIGGCDTHQVAPRTNVEAFFDQVT